MNLIALKFLAAGMIAVGLLLLTMAIGAGWELITCRIAGLKRCEPCGPDR